MTSVDTSLADALAERRSVRGFSSEPVPQTLMEQVFAEAQQAPSNCNVQPWRVLIASGDVRDELRRRMVARAAGGEPVAPDYDELPRFEGVHRQRQVDCAAALYQNMGVARDDKEGRARAALRNFELFDAPHVAFFGMDRSFGVTVALDVGMYLQSLWLAMTAHGMGACAQGSMRYYPQDVREVFGEPESTAILCGMSFGFEDPAVAANNTRVGRAPLEENLVFREQL